MTPKRKQRTYRQNRSLHLFFRELANALNEAGLDMRKTLKPDVEIPWNPQSVKEHLWRPIQQAMTGKKSTTEMNTVDPSEIYEVLNRHLGEKFCLHVPWPHDGHTMNTKRCDDEYQSLQK